MFDPQSLFFGFRDRHTACGAYPADGLLWTESPLNEKGGRHKTGASDSLTAVDYKISPSPEFCVDLSKKAWDIRVLRGNTAIDDRKRVEIDTRCLTVRPL